MKFKENLVIYDRICHLANIERKGKTMPYTSSNGYMFSALNKDGELGIRFSKERQHEYFEKFETTYFKSYGSVMKDYVLITEDLLQNESVVSSLLRESYNYVNSLPANNSKPKKS